MAKRIGILVLRGSGASGFNRQEKFMNKLYKRLEKIGFDNTQIGYEYVDWYGHLQTNQETILERMYSAKVKLRSRITRKLLITNIDDLITYGGKPNVPSQAYEKTHELVHQSIVKLESQLEDNSPMIVIASSMGTEIINNYIWDRQELKKTVPPTPDAYGNTPFKRFETLVGLFTFGNNIPIFAAAHNLDELKPIDFPQTNLVPGMTSNLIWENYYDKNDSMGYPIKVLNDNYKNSKVEDIHINVGGLLMSWNLLSHFGYWTSRKLVKRIADYISSI